MGGISSWEAAVLLLVVLLVVGPDKLPEIAAQVARWLRTAREFVTVAKERVQEEIGDDVDLAALDPRQYDPRRMLRDTFSDSSGGAAVPRMHAPSTRPAGSPTPFDDEAT